MPLSASVGSGAPAPQYLSVVASDRSLIDKHSPGALSPSQELKYFNPLTQGTSTFLNILGAVPPHHSEANLFRVSQGVGATERVGRTATIHLWSFRLHVTCSSIVATATQQCRAPLYRVVAGIDHQPIGSGVDEEAIKIEELFATTTTNLGHAGYMLPFNPVNEQRFTILYDKFGSMKQDNSYPITAGGVVTPYALTEAMEFKTVLNLKCEFSETTGPSSTERPFLFVVLPQTLEVDPSPDFSFTTVQAMHMFRYTD